MHEIWLKPNRRILALTLVVPLAAATCGIFIMLAASGLRYWPWGMSMLIISFLLGIWLIRKMFLPRLGYRRGYLLVCLSRGRPIAVPIDLVKCFCLSHTRTLFTGIACLETQISALIIQLDRKAKSFRSRKTRASLGAWENGSITIRGTWCEPLCDRVVASLNERLQQAHAECNQQHPGAVTPGGGSLNK